MNKTSFAQCNFSISDNIVCAGETVTFSVLETGNWDNFDYEFRIEGNKIEGNSVTYIFQGQTTDRNVAITLWRRTKGTSLNFAKCCCVPNKTVTVKASPDAAVVPNDVTLLLPGDPSSEPPRAFRKCGYDPGNPNFTLVLDNISQTKTDNNSYSIDWDDGSAIDNYPNGTNSFSHTYTSDGEYIIKVSITATGFAGCNTVTREYTFFYGGDPTINVSEPASKQGCLPLALTFGLFGYDNNTDGTTYEVSFEDETLDTTLSHPPPTSVSWTYLMGSCGAGVPGASTPDVYVFEIKAINLCKPGGVRKAVDPIEVGDTVEPEIQISDDPICQGEVITFTNKSKGEVPWDNCIRPQNIDWEINPTTGWHFQPAGQDLIEEEEIKVVFDSAWDFTITMSARNTCDSGTIDTMIEVLEKPELDIDLALGDTCAPDTFYITNNSTGDDNSYNWTVTPNSSVAFIMGTSSNSAEPIIKINKGGTYKIKVRVNNGCSMDTWDTTVVIHPQPLVSIESLGDTCVPNGSTFSYTPKFGNSIDTVGADITWTFGGGSPSTYIGNTPPNVTWNTSGDHYVKVEASSKCGIDTAREDFSITYVVPPTLIPPQTLCFSDAPIGLTPTGASITWSGPGVSGNSFNPRQGGVGSYYIYYAEIISNGTGSCTLGDSVLMSVRTITNFSAGGNDTICVSNGIYNFSGAFPVGGTWFGDGVSNTTTGEFDPNLVALTTEDTTLTIGYRADSSGCIDTAYKTVTIINVPGVQLVPVADTQCVNTTIIFEIDTTGVIVDSVYWDFGDGNNSFSFVPQHAYSATGDYTITVDVYGRGGCVNQLTKSIAVRAKPDIDFTFVPPSGCNNILVDFTSIINNPTEIPNTNFYQWSFGNGTTSTLQNPTGIPYNQGVEGDTFYIAELQVINICGIGLKRDTIVVERPPSARIGISQNVICPTDQLQIFNASSDNATTWQWDFGNGVTSNLENPLPQTYPPNANDMVYDIILEVSNTCGSDRDTVSVTVKGNNVTAGFNRDPTTGCEPLDVRFENFSSPGATVVWDFGDGNTSTQQDTVWHTFDAGTFTVTLTADNGCYTATRSFNITALPKPNVNFVNLPRGCTGEPVSFNNFTTGAAGYEWDFGDGNTNSSTFSPNHTYAIDSIYLVQLTATSSNGCIDSASSFVEIFESPMAGFTVLKQTICEGEILQITNDAINANSFVWHFGDGTQSTVINPIKTYATDGVYTISQVVYNSPSCKDSVAQLAAVRVLDGPTADFTYLQTPLGIQIGEVEFLNASQGADSYIWDFGDSTFSTEVDPVHQFLNNGIQTVQLIAINDLDCTDTIVKLVDINFFGDLFIPNAFTPDVGTGEVAYFQPKGFGLREYRVEVYSTYGELLWSSSELLDGQPTERWDGTFKGKPLPQDAYVWKIRAIFQNGQAWEGMDDGSGNKSNIGTLFIIR